MSPLKKKIQDLNSNIIQNMNESYQEAARRDKYGGSDYQPGTQPGLANAAMLNNRGMAGPYQA